LEIDEMRRKAAVAEVVDTYVLQKAIFGGLYVSKGSTFRRFRGYKNTKSEANTIIQIWILASPRRIICEFLLQISMKGTGVLTGVTFALNNFSSKSLGLQCVAS
jgi:hypothetical protein